MTRVLVTGIGGFVSAHLIQHLFEKTEWDIVGIDFWRHKGTPERIKQVLSKNPDWAQRLTVLTHDLSVLLPERTMKQIGPCDFIVNVASESHVDRSIDHPVAFLQNNVGIALTMLEFARACPCKAFIQISTDEVYGPAPDGINHKEWSPIVPSNPYAASKAAQEAIAISYWRTYGVPVVITNSMNNFGEMQDPEKYMAKVIRLVTTGGTIPIHGRITTNGAASFGSRFYLHARNHADAILFILRNTSPAPYRDIIGQVPDRYNVVGDHELNNLDVAQMIASFVGKPLHYEVVDYHHTRPGHDRRYALDGGKIKALGWESPISLADSLKKYVQWTLNNPIWL